MHLVILCVMVMNTVLIGYFMSEAREVRKGRNVPAMGSMFYPSAVMVCVDLFVLVLMAFW